jgi:hypothetical protein
VLLLLTLIIWLQSPTAQTREGLGSYLLPLGAPIVPALRLSTADNPRVPDIARVAEAKALDNLPLEEHSLSE